MVIRKKVSGGFPNVFFYQCSGGFPDVFLMRGGDFLYVFFNDGKWEIPNAVQ